MNKFYHIKYTLYSFFILSILFWGCKEDVGITINKVGQKPPSVSNVIVTPISGGAILKYDLPQFEDLRYIKAIYKLNNGTTKEVKSSIYNNQLTVAGFGAEGSYDVELRSVGVGEVESDPLTVKVQTLRPPYRLVLDKLKENNNIVATFGGLNLDYFNETKADLVIRIIKKDSTGKWSLIKSEYTNLLDGVIRIRGQESKPTDFGVYVEDRYDHFSDTFFVNKTPIEEIAIPRTKWARLGLPNDVAVRASGFPFTGIWDGNTNVGFLSTSPNIELPNSVTIDLGVPARLSRMQMWATRYSSLADVFGSAHIYDFEMYGSNNPNSTGEWDASWTSLGRFVSSRPLTGFGFGVPATVAEQNNIRDNGETYEFPDPITHDKYRYIRIRTYATWNGSYEGSSNIFIFELYLFGQL